MPLRSILVLNPAARSAVVVSSTLRLSTAEGEGGAMKLRERGIYTLAGIEPVAVGGPDKVNFLLAPHDWDSR